MAEAQKKALKGKIVLLAGATRGAGICLGRRFTWETVVTSLGHEGIQKLRYDT